MATDERVLRRSVLEHIANSPSPVWGGDVSMERQKALAFLHERGFITRDGDGWVATPLGKSESRQGNPVAMSG